MLALAWFFATTNAYSLSTSIQRLSKRGGNVLGEKFPVLELALHASHPLTSIAMLKPRLLPGL
jgi:hypothetical protein